jgi:microcin C transport system permease protein
MKKLKKHKLALVGAVFLIMLMFFSLSAEIWSNSKPLVLKYAGKTYFPIFKDYHPSIFGIENQFVTDYRELEKNFTEQDFIIWPVNKWNPLESNKTVERYPSPPTKDNWFGTDDRGRDVFARLLYGFRYTLLYAVGVWFLSYLIGTFFGAIFGYFGGKIDLIGGRLIELIEMTPQLLLLITLISIFDPSIWLLVLFSVLFDWTGIYHYMRAQFLQLRKREFVEAAQALSVPTWKIIFRHLLPNALTPILTFSLFSIATNISGLALLDYLGLGLKPPTPSWGELIAQAQKYFSMAEWLVWYPSALLLLTMISLIQIGLAVRDLNDSRMT